MVLKGWFLNNAVNSQRDVSSNNKKVGVNHQRAEGPPLGRQITEKDVVDIQLENFKGDLFIKSIRFLRQNFLDPGLAKP